MGSQRLLIVSNRLPVAASIGSDQGVALTDASGGLATGLRSWYEAAEGAWIGWPGDVSHFSELQRRTLDELLRARRIRPVVLSRDHVNRYYHGFANRVLWPLFHYLIDRVPLDATGWDAYRQVNARFADAVLSEYRDGDLVWIHDYQLMLLPAMIRRRLPRASIGFFLHIPFPSSEVFRILPWRRDVLAGLLGADLIGFHTYAYLRHFLSSLLHVDGVETDVDRVRVGGRDVHLGVFPMGIDARSFNAEAADSGTIALSEKIRRDAAGRRIILGVDRLDYTKGIPRRLTAIERLLTRQPTLRDQIQFIQVAVPSRDEVDSYQRFRRQVEELIGRVNGTCGTLRSTPIHYLHQSVVFRELVALYRAADVMMVTPLRDGMNLVAKEFVASRPDEDGVLILSEFAGAANELAGAVLVNPYDVDAVADSVEGALDMPPAERRERIRGLRERVLRYDVHGWAGEFIARLQDAVSVGRGPVRGEATAIVATMIRAKADRGLRLLLDYDGTLVPIAPLPHLAVPDDELLQLLGQLAIDPAIELEIVSGRPPRVLSEWFGHLPVVLWGEHGFWRREETDWIPAVELASDVFERVRPILERFTASTPGSHIEVKTASVAWHYRLAPADFADRQAHELRLLLGDALSNQPLEVLEGKKVIEVRLRGISKAAVATRTRARASAFRVVAFGDDRTDEHLFGALPLSSLRVAVGQHLSGATHVVDDHRSVRRLLQGLVASRLEPGAFADSDGTAGDS